LLFSAKISSRRPFSFDLKVQPGGSTIIERDVV
jgi:hypothetical protein